jgi:hypothetical protein
LNNNDYGSIGHSLGVMHAYAAFAGHVSADRSLSTASAEGIDGVGSLATCGPGQLQRLQPIYDYYSRPGNYGTVIF